MLTGQQTVFLEYCVLVSVKQGIIVELGLGLAVVFVAADVDYLIDGRQCEPMPCTTSEGNVEKSLVIANALLEDML